MTYRLLTASLLALIAWFYVWTVGQGQPLPFGQTHSDAYYNGLTDAFLAGKLSLPAEPSPQLMALQDPYDPKQNAGMTLHDASYYKGKYYLYFGVTPVVLLFLPFRALGIGDLPQSVAVAVFTFVGVVFWFLTLSLARRTLVPGRGAGVLYATLLTLGFGGAIPYMLRRPVMYEVAISCGFLCLAAVVYFSTSVVLEKKPSHWKAGLAGVFMGLAVGARPNLVFAAPFLGLVWMWHRRRGYRHLRQLAVALAAPFLAVMFLLAVYNFARFGSPTEFGLSYQLAGLDVRLLLADTRRIPFFAYFYLWFPLDVNWVFPYAHVAMQSALSLPLPGFSSVEPVAGVFFTTPLLFALACLPLVWRSTGPEPLEDEASQKARLLGRLAASLVAVAGVQILFLSTRSGVTMRYIVDFSGLLVTAAGMVLLGLELRPRRVRSAGTLATALLVPLVALGVFFNLGIGLTGYYDNLKGSNPATYEAIRSATDPVATALASWVLSGDASIVSVSAPTGVTKERGAETFWVGKDEAHVNVFAVRQGSATLRFRVTRGTNRPDLPTRRLMVRTAYGFSDVRTVVNDGEVTLVVPVRRGINEVGLTVLDVPQAVPPSTGPEFAALHVEGWSVVLADN